MTIESKFQVGDIVRHIFGPATESYTVHKIDCFPHPFTGMPRVCLDVSENPSRRDWSPESNFELVSRPVALAEKQPADLGERLGQFSQTINQMVEQIHTANVEAGWYTDLTTGERKQRNIGEMLMLIVTEVAEAMEGHRKDLMDDKLPHRKMMEVELADTVIRIFDLAGYCNYDLGGAIQEKLAFNAKRSDHKIENRKADGGKKC